MNIRFDDAGQLRLAIWFGFGAVLGVAAYAIFDPRRGAARRAKLRDKTVAAGHDAADEAKRRLSHAKWRTKGRLHEVKARFEEHDIPDFILEERVRAQIGRPVSHPRALEVKAQNGTVTLCGPILAAEVDQLLGRVKGVRGVRAIDNQLEVHTAPDIPSLQGKSSPQRRS